MKEKVESTKEYNLLKMRRVKKHNSSHKFIRLIKVLMLLAIFLVVLTFIFLAKNKPTKINHKANSFKEVKNQYISPAERMKREQNSEKEEKFKPIRNEDEEIPEQFLGKLKASDREYILKAVHLTKRDKSNYFILRLYDAETKELLDSNTFEADEFYYIPAPFDVFGIDIGIDGKKDNELRFFEVKNEHIVPCIEYPKYIKSIVVEGKVHIVEWKSEDDFIKKEEKKEEEPKHKNDKKEESREYPEELYGKTTNSDSKEYTIKHTHFYKPDGTCYYTVKLYDSETGEFLDKHTERADHLYIDVAPFGVLALDVEIKSRRKNDLHFFEIKDDKIVPCHDYPKYITSIIEGKDKRHKIQWKNKEKYDKKYDKKDDKNDDEKYDHKKQEKFLTYLESPEGKQYVLRYSPFEKNGKKFVKLRLYDPQNEELLDTHFIEADEVDYSKESIDLVIIEAKISEKSEIHFFKLKDDRLIPYDEYLRQSNKKKN